MRREACREVEEDGEDSRAEVARRMRLFTCFLCWGGVRGRGRRSIQHRCCGLHTVEQLVAGEDGFWIEEGLWLALA